MGIGQSFYIDTTASRQTLRDLIVQAGIGFEARPDFEYISNANTPATHLGIREMDKPTYSVRFRTDNGVFPKRVLTFSAQDYMLLDEWRSESLRAMLALLKAYPEADAYLVQYDAELPALLRKSGCLVLSEQLTDQEIWDPSRPFLALVDLPYTIAPLGPWEDVPR